MIYRGVALGMCRRGVFIRVLHIDLVEPIDFGGPAAELLIVEVCSQWKIGVLCYTIKKPLHFKRNMLDN